jgi:DUF4097 and DUF4098 domain-containing protein YvlB
MVQANLMHGSITVRGYDGKDVIIEGNSRMSDRSSKREFDGLRRIDINNTGLNVEEQDNIVRISASSHARPVDLVIQVPTLTSVKLKSVNAGHINVERVEGEIDVNNTNGAVTLTDVAGAVVAHTLNGKLTVALNRVTPNKPMSFSTLNGDVDVTLPPDIKATVKLKTDNGDIYTDFDILTKPTSQSKIEEGQPGKGKYRVRLDRAFYGTINGGGPEMSFTTLNGKILIRKKK